MTRVARHIACGLLLFLGLALRAQPPGYYDPAEGLSGEALRQALHTLIGNQSVRTYSQLWEDFLKTDAKADGTVWDMYSDNPAGPEPYVYTFVTNQCGNYSGEGDCYNREHSFPKSWFGGEILPMYTDLFHLYPTDGYVNNQRGNLPYGETASPSWTSLNGSRVGPCSVSGYTGNVFEPIDAYKGDLARTYFYMAVRYYGEDGSWPGSDMTDGAEPLPWALAMLIQWNEEDPVSEKEIARNDSVYKIQGNRNPFIDRPQYVDAIWNAPNSTREIAGMWRSMQVYPVPASESIRILLPDLPAGFMKVEVYSLSGSLLLEKNTTSGSGISLDISSLSPGLYFLEVRTSTGIYRQKFVVE